MEKSEIIFVALFIAALIFPAVGIIYAFVWIWAPALLAPPVFGKIMTTLALISLIGMIGSAIMYHEEDT